MRWRQSIRQWSLPSLQTHQVNLARHGAFWSFIDLSLWHLIVLLIKSVLSQLDSKSNFIPFIDYAFIQINLVVGDYFKAKARYFVHCERAAKLIEWLRSKTYVLALLRNVQLHIRPNHPPLSIIRAVLTRWTAHYLAYSRLLSVRSALETLIAEDEVLAESQIITGDRVARERSTAMVSIVGDSSFWYGLARSV